MNNFGTKKKHALKLPEIRIPSLRQALLIAAMAVTVILAVTALSLQAIQPSYTTTNLQFTLSSSGEIQPSTATVSTDNACIGLDATNHNGFNRWSFAGGNNPSPQSGFCTIPWDRPQEMKITAFANGHESVATIKFQ